MRSSHSIRRRWRRPARLTQSDRRVGRAHQCMVFPWVLKDNMDTADLPTTAGSFMLAGSLPPDDAFLVTRLREAGAIILAKVNMSEFASGDSLSSLGGPTYNPHDSARTPSGSSGGTGAAIAAAYALVGLGTDTGGSVRGPSAANGIVGLKPTHGLLSRDGIVPLALSFDTAGPMARTVYDVAGGVRCYDGSRRCRRGYLQEPGAVREGTTLGIWTPQPCREPASGLPAISWAATLKWTGWLRLRWPQSGTPELRLSTSACPAGFCKPGANSIARSATGNFVPRSPTIWAR